MLRAAGMVPSWNVILLMNFGVMESYVLGSASVDHHSQLWAIPILPSPRIMIADKNRFGEGVHPSPGILLYCVHMYVCVYHAVMYFCVVQCEIATDLMNCFR